MNLNLSFLTDGQAPSVDDLVDRWDRGDHLMFDACSEFPEAAWDAVKRLSLRALTRQQMALLAGGPIEKLLSLHGVHFIERLEHEAQLNPRIKDILGGVWRSDISEDVWLRVCRLRTEAW